MALRLFFFLARCLLPLRYRIEIRGMEELKRKVKDGERGILFLPNHPAHMDPLIFMAYFWPVYRMRPLVVEHIFRSPLMRPFMRAIRALPVPNFDVGVNQFKVRKAEQSFQEIAKGLKEKKNFVLYPSGRLKLGAKEIIGGASAAHSLVQECPEIDVVLVRTTGLWGSSFSRAILGRSPDLNEAIWNAAKMLLRNLLFFAPRRKILIEIEPNPPSIPRKSTRVEFNRALEIWYDQYPDGKGNRVPEEPIQLVSYSFWRNDVPVPFKPKEKKNESNGAEISPKVRDKIYGEIRRIMDRADLPLSDEMSLPFDIGMDSLNIGEMVAFLSHEYETGEIHPEDLTTVRSLLEIAEGSKIGEGRAGTAPRHAWPQESARPDPVLPLGRTLAEAFLNSCERLGSLSACGDDLVGVLSYKQMKRVALVLAQSFRKLEGDYVGVMLPASCGAFIAILGLQLAGKIPVMLNWTLGPRYLDEMMKASGAKVAISSFRFLERLNHVDFGDLVDRFVFLEEIREQLTLFEKLKGAFLSLLGTQSALRRLNISDVDENSPCVVLFTSGTEAVPKGVPLTHKNIMSNLRSGMQCIEILSGDVIYDVLPPFHSFGFTVTGLFPLFAGVRVAFYPDPTDSFAMAEGIQRWQATFFCAPPSFLKGLLSAAKPEQVKTIRYFVSGAEKLPPDLRDRTAKVNPDSLLIEGYGITECSPILTISRPHLPPKGVGLLLPELELCTIHPESQELLPPGAEGEICVRGPSVFSGYLGKPRDPFIELKGKKWYRTGDLGHLDPDGSLILSGRLKRFTKLGGEMISLGAVEEALIAELSRRGSIASDLPSLAVCCDERTPGRPQLIVFSTVALNRDEANEILKTAGFSRLVKISSVQTIAEIPLMGTGKTDYRRLQSTLA